jgi:hypothetical protein
MRASVDLAQDVVSYTGIAPNARKTVSSSGEWGFRLADMLLGRRMQMAQYNGLNPEERARIAETQDSLIDLYVE